MENTIEDKLLSLLKEEFTSEEQQNFLDNFKLYLEHGNDCTKFVIDFDNVYEWIGFGQKGHAKRLLLKQFVINVDYVTKPLSLEGKRFNGGQNKENIFLNVSTFKAMCMIANTDQGKRTRMYYTKMETIFFKYMEDKQHQLIRDMELEGKKREEILKHNTLLDILDDKRTIYLTRVKAFDDGRFVVKLGWSDGISDRNRSHGTHFGASLLLDVFECTQNREFELFLKRHPKVARYAYTDPIIDDVCSSETYAVMPFEYDYIIKIIRNNIKYYQGYSAETLVELERLKLMSSIMAFAREKGSSIEDASALLQAVNAKAVPQVDELMQSENDTEAEQDNEATPKLIGRTCVGRKIQRYDADTLKLIETYQGIMAVLRKHPQMSKFGIKHAAAQNTIYNGFRWYILEKKMEVKEYEIPQTKKVNSSIPRLVAMINKDKTRIEKVFVSQQEAMEGIGITRKQTINDAIKKDRIYKNTHYFAFYDECLEELKAEYLSRATLPDSKLSKGTKIIQKDIVTNNVIATYNSISETMTKVCISRASLKRACMNHEAHAGFLWEFAD